MNRIKNKLIKDAQHDKNIICFRFVNNLTVPYKLIYGNLSMRVVGIIETTISLMYKINKDDFISAYNAMNVNRLCTSLELDLWNKRANMFRDKDEMKNIFINDAWIMFKEYIVNNAYRFLSRNIGKDNLLQDCINIAKDQSSLSADIVSQMEIIEIQVNDWDDDIVIDVTTKIDNLIRNFDFTYRRIIN